MNSQKSTKQGLVSLLSGIHTGTCINHGPLALFKLAGTTVDLSQYKIFAPMHAVHEGVTWGVDTALKLVNPQDKVRYFGKMYEFTEIPHPATEMVMQGISWGLFATGIYTLSKIGYNFATGKIQIPQLSTIKNYKVKKL